MHFPFIVFKDSAYDRGRKMCERLKEEIPRHLFEIPIQAAVGGKDHCARDGKSNA